jgi:hypothetical protein
MSASTTYTPARIEHLLDRLDKVRQTRRQQWTACCPSHEDRRASLSVGVGTGGRILLRCHAGCSLDAICAALSIHKGDLFPDGRRDSASHRQLLATYGYHDERGALLYEVLRYSPKDFKQRRPDGRGDWVWKMAGIRRVPYRLQEVLADASGELWLLEGEKDADRGAKLGLNTTTTAGGADNFRMTAEAMQAAAKGRKVFIVPDADDAGDDYAQDALKALRLVAASVRIIRLPRLTQRAEHGEDLTDWLDKHGGSLQELRALADAPTDGEDLEHELNERNENRSNDEGHNSFSSFNSFPDPPRAEAFYGLAGDYVRAIEPHTEADPAALLVQFITMFGNAAGRHCFSRAEADRHYPALFAVLVGNTSHGRKGTSWGQVQAPYARVDDEWASGHIASGLSSGEGLIHALRDVDPDDPACEKEPLLRDKRLLIHQGEFASVLKMLTREGNILSDVLRLAWDGAPLRVLTKLSPERASHAHISIVGHITKDELLRYLTATETGNGFGNRFLWVCVKRSKLLPDGGNLGSVDFSTLDELLRLAFLFARQDREITRDPEARQLWHEVYARLSEGLPGMLGSMLARAEAQVMRISMMYALLDRSPFVRRVHLEAALALWDYAEASARFIFGDALGDPVADTILQALRAAAPEGMTRTDISSLFGRNKDATKELAPALKKLIAMNLARVDMEQTGGRPAERWYAVTPITTSPNPERGYERNERNEESREGASVISFDSFNSSRHHASEVR